MLKLRKIRNSNTLHNLNIILKKDSWNLINLFLKRNIFKSKFSHLLLRVTDINIRSYINITRFMNANLKLT